MGIAAAGTISAPGFAGTTYFQTKTNVQGLPNSKTKRLGLAASDLALFGVNPVIGFTAPVVPAILKKFRQPKIKNAQQII